jgi:hypothetical protein
MSLFRVPVLAAATFALVSPAAAQGWGWGTGCGCSQPVAAVVDPIPYVTPPPPVALAPVVAAAFVVAPNVPRPIYVVNQGPVYAGPDVTIVPSLRVDGPYQPYPYVRTFGGYPKYAVRRPYYRPNGVYHRPHYRPARYYKPHYRPLPPK